jgi:creatinine amidohydrolase
VATAVCEDVARARPVDIAPSLGYSASGEHAGFAGLLSLGTTVTAALLTELVRSSRATWSRVIVVSAHGGNAEALGRVLEVARSEGDDVAVWLPSDRQGDAHAGLTETSVLLSIDPDLVHLDRMVVGIDPSPAQWTVMRSEGVGAVSPSGVLGDPTGATAQRGRDIRERWCAEVVTLIDSGRVA